MEAENIQDALRSPDALAKENLQLQVKEEKHYQAINELKEVNSVGQRAIHIELKWEDVVVTPKPETAWCRDSKNKVADEKDVKIILNHIAGFVRPRQFLSIIGASGAGKTTLLNYLSNKMFPADLNASGNITINGIDRNAMDYFKFTAFVQQDDVLMESMTVREILEFTAAMKCSPEPDIQEQKIKEMLSELELTGVENVPFGGFGAENCLTKGEKKRLSIAVELITNPALVFMDEPTTGMDTFTAEKIIQIINKLKDKGRTVIATIHQPNTEIFKQMDRLMLLAYGNVLYFGQAKDAKEYFTGIGQVCPEDQNPAEFFMAMMTKDCPDKKQKLASLVDSYKQSGMLEDQQKEAVSLTPLENVDLNSIKYSASWAKQFRLLFVRAWTVTFRSVLVNVMRYVTQIIFAVLSLTLYYDLGKTTYENFLSRIGAIFYSALASKVTALMMAILVFPEERAVFMREQASSIYDVSPYYISKIVAEFPFAMVEVLIYSVLSYWLIGFNTEDSTKFLVFYFGLLSCYVSSGSYSYVIGSFVSDREVLLIVIPLISLPLMLLSGFFVSLDSSVTILWPFQFISSFKYGFNLLARNEFEDNSEVYVETITRIFNPGTGTYVNYPVHLDSNYLLNAIEADMSLFECFLGNILLWIGFSALALIILKVSSRHV